MISMYILPTRCTYGKHIWKHHISTFTNISKKPVNCSKSVMPSYLKSLGPATSCGKHSTPQQRAHPDPRECQPQTGTAIILQFPRVLVDVRQLRLDHGHRSLLETSLNQWPSDGAQLVSCERTQYLLLLEHVFTELSFFRKARSELPYISTNYELNKYSFLTGYCASWGITTLVVGKAVTRDGKPLGTLLARKLLLEHLGHALLYWVAVKKLKLSYCIGETLLFTIYTHYGNLI